jgi:hypothetical protein
MQPLFDDRDKGCVDKRQDLPLANPIYGKQAFDWLACPKLQRGDAQPDFPDEPLAADHLETTPSRLLRAQRLKRI